MRSPAKRLLPILFSVLIIFSILWYLFVYDRAFTKDFLLSQARFFERNGNHSIATWLYEKAYQHSEEDCHIAIEIADQYIANGNYTKAEYTLSQAISENPSAELYVALCKLYVEQDKLLDAVTMLRNVADPDIAAQLAKMRPAVPTAEPAAGFYNKYIDVSIHATGDKLYVSTDGEFPSINTDSYSQALSMPGGETTVYAIAVDKNGLVSELAVFGYTVAGVIEEVTLSSPELDTYVRQLLGKSAEEQLLTSDLWNITTLTVPSSVLDFSDLKYFTKLQSLTINKGNFSDVSFLSGLTALTHLDISNTPLSTTDLKTIATLPSLTHLSLENCGLSNIDNLANAKLVHLDLNNNAVRDISALSFMSTLTSLDLSFNALTNLNALSALTGLEKLNISGNSLSSLRPLSGCTGLTELDASYNTIGVLYGIESLSALRTLNVSNNNLTDVDLLSKITSLQTLVISNNTILNISALSTLVALEHFDFSYNEITALPKWNSSSALIYVDGTHNKVTSVANLSVCKKLNTVIMEYNKISSVTTLAKCQKLVRVNVSGNPVKDVSKLTDNGVIVNYDPV